MYRTFLGYDAGTTSSALGIIGPEPSFGAIFCPIAGKNYVDVATLSEWLNEMKIVFPAIAILELPQARSYRDPSGIVRKQNTDTVFRCYGQAHAVLTMKGFAISEVNASAWKKKMGLHGKTKEECVRFAQQLFPCVDLHRKKDHNRAEALLLAEYGRRFHS